MKMREIVEAREAIAEIHIGGVVDSDHLFHIGGLSDYTNPQQDLFAEIPTLDPKVPKDMKIVGKIGQYRVIKRSANNNIEIQHYNREDQEYVIFDRNIPIAWIGIGKPKRNFSIDMIDGQYKGLQVHSIYVDEDYRGQNLALQLYKWLLTNVVDYLIADDLQTRGGVAIWKKLQNSRQFDVRVFDPEKYDSRHRRSGKDFDQVYHSMRHLVPWVTLRGKSETMMRGQ